MAVMDEFKEEREALKHGTPKQKIQYFLEYYKWHVIIPVVAVIAIVSTIISIVNRKETALYVCMLNVSEKLNVEGTLQSTSNADHNAAFVEYAGIDTDEYEVQLDTGMSINYSSLTGDDSASAQKYMTYLAAAEMDVIVTDAASIEHYAYLEDFYDLREILTPEQIEKYEPYFYYIDMVTVAERNEMLEDPDSLHTDYILIGPDPRKPEEMQEPVPVAIYMDDCDLIREHFYFQTDEVVAGVFVNTTRLDMALQYLNFLLGEEPLELPLADAAQAQ